MSDSVLPVGALEDKKAHQHGVSEGVPMISPDAPATQCAVEFKDGDVVRYRSERDNRWCREGTAVHYRGRMVDTYWDLSGGDDHVLTVNEMESAELLFNVVDYDQLPRYDRGNRSKWQRYAPADRQRWTAQHGLQARYFIRRGAVEDLPTKVLNARDVLEQAESELRSAEWRVRMAREELAKLEEVS